MTVRYELTSMYTEAPVSAIPASDCTAHEIGDNFSKDILSLDNA
jgi:hypothetical protein